MTQDPHRDQQRRVSDVLHQPGTGQLTVLPRQRRPQPGESVTMIPPDPQVMFFPRPRLKNPTSPPVPSSLPSMAHAHRLGGVLDHENVPIATDLSHMLDVSRDAEQMRRYHAQRVVGDDTPRARRDRNRRSRGSTSHGRTRSPALTTAEGTEKQV